MWVISKRRIGFVIKIIVLSQHFINAVRNYEHVCGFEQKCTQTGTNVEQKKESCCFPCECSDICEERGTCCGDKKGLNRTVTVVKQQCLPALYRPEGQRSRYIASQSYYTRTRCPRSYTDLTIKEKCESGKPEKLEDIILVSPEDGSSIYKNRFCGVCNGEKKTENWKLILHPCKRLLTDEYLNFESMSEVLLSHCFIGFARPSNVDWRRIACFDGREVIDKCNQTAKWEVYDSTLENLCLEPPESVYYIHMQNKEIKSVFGNLYCFLCNMEANIAPNICQGNTEILKVKDMFQLINLNIWTGPNAWIREDRCMPDQILDTFFSRCRTLFCPVFSLPRNGKCVTFLDIGLSYQLNIRLVPLEPLYQSASLKNHLKSKYVSIQRNLGFGKCKMCYVHINLPQNRNGTTLREIYVTIALQPTERCKSERLRSKLTSIEISPSYTKIRLNVTLVRFKVFWGNDIQLPPVAVEHIVRLGTYNNCRPLPVKRAANCPKVKLTTSEYVSVQERHKNGKELLVIPDKDDTNNTSVFVCCDNYIMRQSSTGEQTSIYAQLTLFGTIFASVVAGF